VSDERWLLVDSLNIAHRMFHAVPPMNGPKDSRTEVIFGFLREIRKLEAKFAACRLFFFFDSGAPKRLGIYPAYKGNREESRAKRKGTDKDDKFLQAQILELREHILPRLGYNNVYHEEGYEADDLIAIFSRNNVPQYPSRTAVIVSSDHDFRQVLFGHVFTDGGRTVLKQSYVEQYCPRTDSITTAAELGMTKKEIILAKAIEGCGTDNIKGVPGFGPIKAQKAALGGYKEGTKEHDSITAHKDLIALNTKLVSLPIDWSVIMEEVPDTVRQSKWDKVLREYGIRSMR